LCDCGQTLSQWSGPQNRSKAGQRSRQFEVQNPQLNLQQVPLCHPLDSGRRRVNYQELVDGNVRVNICDFFFGKSTIFSRMEQLEFLS